MKTKQEPDEGPYPFEPDWCIAPAETLRDWLEENHLSPQVFSVACGGQQHKAAALELIREVLACQPLGELHAACLARGTGVSVRMWLALEHNYRAGLAAGLTDATSTDTAARTEKILSGADRDLCARCGNQFPAGQLCRDCAGTDPFEGIR